MNGRGEPGAEQLDQCQAHGRVQHGDQVAVHRGSSHLFGSVWPGGPVVRPDGAAGGDGHVDRPRAERKAR
ncbi:hypothetical protein GCM10010441_40750 [Kitasatospora paracochleata]